MACVKKIIELSNPHEILVRRLNGDNLGEEVLCVRIVIVMVSVDDSLR